MEPKPGETVLPFATPAAFERWLAEHHASAAVIWIKHAKKTSGFPTITWTEAVDVVLCYGWIDGQSKSLDDTHYVQRYTPRRSRSLWSKLNRERVARLIETGRMRAAGLAEVERAKSDGRWDVAYDSPKTAAIPEDLAAALAKDRKAAARFATLDATNRYAILHRLQTAKQAATRTRRLETFVAMLADGKTLHPVAPKAKPKATAKPAPKVKPKAKAKPAAKAKSRR